MPRIVVDAKYKSEKPSGFPQTDLYQMLAYCTTIGLSAGHLVHAKGHEESREYTIRNSGVRVVARTIDLALEPESLIWSVAVLASNLGGASIAHL